MPLEDIIVVGKSFDDYMKNIEQTFQRPGLYCIRLGSSGGESHFKIGRFPKTGLKSKASLGYVPTTSTKAKTTRLTEERHFQWKDDCQ